MILLLILFTFTIILWFQNKNLITKESNYKKIFDTLKIPTLSILIILLIHFSNGKKNTIQLIKNDFFVDRSNF
jgi:hypothetical protein